jgi:hypothetical protein
MESYWRRVKGRPGVKDAAVPLPNNRKVVFSVPAEKKSGVNQRVLSWRH